MEKISAILNLIKIVAWAACWIVVIRALADYKPEKKGNKQMEKKPIYTKESVVILYDAAEYPSVMLKVENTAPTREDADPMFIVKGVEYDAIYLPRFMSSLVDGHAVSLPFMVPAVMCSMDDAIRKSREKGPGWHLLTVAEWRYILRTMAPEVHGNTYRGRYHGEEDEEGILCSGNYTTLTGSGPASWFHNGDKKTGIADIVGNAWKILAGVRLKNGVLQYMPDNDAAADDADLSSDSAEFVTATAAGMPVRIGPSENGMSITTGEVEGWDAVSRKDVVVDLEEIPEILFDLGILTEDMESSSEWFAADADLDEAVCYAGAGFGRASASGPSALSLLSLRSRVSSGLGFLSACLGKPVIR